MAGRDGCLWEEKFLLPSRASPNADGAVGPTPACVGAYSVSAGPRTTPLKLPENAVPDNESRPAPSVCVPETLGTWSGLSQYRFDSPKRTHSTEPWRSKTQFYSLAVTGLLVDLSGTATAGTGRIIWLCTGQSLNLESICQSTNCEVEKYPGYPGFPGKANAGSNNPTR
eukprot:3874323-Rhodomonas_salina.1